MAADDRAPWEVIRAAADKIEKLAGEATPGQWEIEFDYHGKIAQAVFRMHPEHPDAPDFSVGLGAMDAAADNVWIATLSPAVAEPLVAWLRATAMAWLECEYGQDETFAPEALAFAIKITGESPCP